MARLYISNKSFLPKKTKMITAFPITSTYFSNAIKHTNNIHTAAKVANSAKGSKRIPFNACAVTHLVPLARMRTACTLLLQSNFFPPFSQYNARLVFQSSRTIETGGWSGQLNHRVFAAYPIHLYSERDVCVCARGGSGLRSPGGK